MVTTESLKFWMMLPEIIKKETFSLLFKGMYHCTDGTVDAIDKKTNQRNLSVARAKMFTTFL